MLSLPLWASLCIVSGAAITPNKGDGSKRNLPTSKFFAVARSGSGRWSAGNTRSYYADRIDGATPIFTTLNGSMEATVQPDGTLKSVTVFGATVPNAPVRSMPGGWVTWPRSVIYPSALQVVIDHHPVETPSATWPVHTAYVDDVIPMSDYRGETVRVVSIVFAPISADGARRPRALIWGITVLNTSGKQVDIELRIGKTEGLDLSTREGAVVQDDNLRVSLRPREKLWIPLLLTRSGERDALKQIQTLSPELWLKQTRAYWGRVTGSLIIPRDPFTAELVRRMTVLSLESAVFDKNGDVSGVLNGTYPVDYSDNFRDSYYAILTATQRDPALIRAVLPWFVRYTQRPDAGTFKGGLFHSLGNTLNAAMLATLYYDATGDAEFFRAHSELTATITGTLNDVLKAHKPDGPYLFPSTYISDGKSLGTYHTGSNVCAWRSFEGWGRLLRNLPGHGDDAAKFSEAAERIKTDLDRHNIIQGPFGTQYIEGTDADGTVPLMIHDGEETDTTLMPYYGYAASSAEAYRNYLRFAISEYNVAFNPVTRGIMWEDYGPNAKISPVGDLEAAATFPSYITSVAGGASAGTLWDREGAISELRQLTDVSGAWWWWPYGKELSQLRRGHDLRRNPFECGWAEDEFPMVFERNVLGISYNAPGRIFRFAPSGATPDFSWRNLPIGETHFGIRLHHGMVTFTNSADFAVRFLLGSEMAITVLPRSSIQARWSGAQRVSAGDLRHQTQRPAGQSRARRSNGSRD